jgi:hypothetical protein
VGLEHGCVLWYGWPLLSICSIAKPDADCLWSTDADASQAIGGGTRSPSIREHSNAVVWQQAYDPYASILQFGVLTFPVHQVESLAAAGVTGKIVTVVLPC